MCVGESKKQFAKRDLAYFFEVLIALSFILSGHCVWAWSDACWEWFWIIPLSLLGLGVAGSFFILKCYANKKTCLKGFALTAAIVGSLLIFAIINPYSLSSYAKFVFAVGFMAIYIFVCQGEGKIPHALKTYSWVITVVAAFSMIVWIFIITGVLSPSGIFYCEWTGETRELNCYLGVQFATQNFDFAGFTIIRNTFCFTEGPMYAVQLCFALIIDLFLCEKASWVKVLILGAAIFTTFTYTGWIIFL